VHGVPSVTPGFTKLDMWLRYDPQLSSYTYLSPAEEEDYVRAARASPVPGHSVELQELSRSIICAKALPSILRDIARVRSHLTERQVEQCLDTFGWLVAPG
jgi:hypothetical protein